MKTIIERGASWTLEETKMLLAIWGQDFVRRQATNAKRTKETYEQISEKFNQNGFERTPDQVRTRVFNMIAEYRRILKDPTPDRMKKCIFFEALHKIYQAKHMDDVKSALDDYEPENPYSPASNTTKSEKDEQSVSDSEANDGNETSGTQTTFNNSTSTAATSNSINQASSNNNTSSSSTNTGTSTDINNGDSNNNNSEKDSASASSGNKKIKLETPKSGTNQTSNQSTSHSSANSSDPSSSSKQKATSAPASAPTYHHIFGQLPSSPAASSATPKHQSLLLPHVTTAGSTTNSTPITKLTTAGGNNTPSYININSTKLPIIRTNQLIGHPNGSESNNTNGTPNRLPTTAAITSHQLYQAPVSTFDVTSSALLIDRMFAHLSRESENMREWIALEKERLALERVRRQQETEREIRRERALTDTLMKFQEQWLSFLSRLDPRIVENAGEAPPELKMPPRESAKAAEPPQSTQASSSTASGSASQPSQTDSTATSNSSSTAETPTKQ